MQDIQAASAVDVATGEDEAPAFPIQKDATRSTQSNGKEKVVVNEDPPPKHAEPRRQKSRVGKNVGSRCVGCSNASCNGLGRSPGFSHPSGLKNTLGLKNEKNVVQIKGDIPGVDYYPFHRQV